MQNSFKFIKLLSLLLLFCFINTNYSKAECGFDGLTIGEKSSEAEGAFGEANTENNIGIIIVDPEEACPGENLEQVSVEIIISEDEIAGFRFGSQSLKKEDEDNEQSLYQYVAKNYGTIEGAENKNWTGHKIWEINGNKIVYSKIFFLKVFEEELIVTNSKFSDFFIDHDPDLDEPEEEQ